MGLQDLGKKKTWKEVSKEQGLDGEVEQVYEYSDTRTGRILRSASKGRNQPPPPGKESDREEKPCPGCACLSTKHGERGEIIGHKCENEKCGLGYFRLGWNEFRTEESFLSGVEVTGWRLE